MTVTREDSVNKVIVCVDQSIQESHVNIEHVLITVMGEECVMMKGSVYVLMAMKDWPVM
jgi:hypothetical protein